MELINDTGFHTKRLWSEMDLKLYLENKKDYTEKQGAFKMSSTEHKSRVRKVKDTFEIKNNLIGIVFIYQRKDKAGRE